MTNRPRRNPAPESRPLTKRQQAWQQREANVQRRVVLAIGGAIGLALLLIIGGVIWDRLLVPGRSVIAVNGQELTRGDYDRIVRDQTLAQMAQSLQFTKLLGPNASLGQDQGSFTQQVVEANSRLATLGTPRGLREPTDETIVSSWIDQQLIAEKAKSEFGIDPSQGEVDQAIVERLGSLLEEPAPLTSTTELTATAGVTSTSIAEEADATAAATTAAGTEATAEATPVAEQTAASGPTGTSAPTASPTASPVAEVATDKVAQIVKVLHDEYRAILQDLPQGATSDITTAHASEADFAAALRAQYRDELIRTRVKEKLVPTVNEDDATPPEQISARHILLKVPKPEPTPTATAAPEDAGATTTAGETATAEATAAGEETATAQPAPTPTLSPEALEALFAERKAEIDRIYEQVKANPDQFPDLARQYSEDDSNNQQGGDLGSFGRGQMVGPFEEAAFALAENEISAPVRTDFGWHIIQRLPEDPEAKLSRQRDAAFDTWVSGLRASATIVPAPTPTATELPMPSAVATEPAVEDAAPGAEMTSEGTAEAAPEATIEATPEATAAP